MEEKRRNTLKQIEMLTRRDTLQPSENPSDTIQRDTLILSDKIRRDTLIPSDKIRRDTLKPSDGTTLQRTDTIRRESRTRRPSLTLDDLKKEFDKIMKRGQAVPCPSCGTSVPKKNVYSHMICSCGIEWCYACGKEQSQLDMSVPGPPFSGCILTHYQDWKTNENRCPIDLKSIHYLNPSFKKDPLKQFHYNRTRIELKKFMNRIGEEKYMTLYNSFDSVKNCGIKLADIKNAPRHVFRQEESSSCVIS